jgi:beta-N-acetylhexosaminidase
VAGARRRGRRQGAAVAVVLATLLLASCGRGSPEGSPSGSPPGGTTPPASASPTTESSVPGTSTSTKPAEGCELPPLRTRIAQLIIVGFPGKVVNADNTRLVRQGVGGLIVFGPNVQDRNQLRTLLRGLSAKASIPLEIAVDQEPGTRVARLRNLVPRIPPAKDLGKRKPAEVREYGRELGEAMKALGITADFAPVLDVVSPTAPPEGIIGNRSFGSSPATVSRAAIAFEEGLRDAGIGTVGKHFPGHGQTTVDSHETLPVVNASKATLVARDLVPFRDAIKRGLPAVMVGHLLARNLDRDRPTSLSPKVIDGLLRKEMGFDRMVVTDALEMGAISGDRTIPVAAEMALLAGADQLLLGAGHGQVTPTIDRIEQGVRTGRVPEERVSSAFLRVQRFKGVDRWDACG